MTGDLLDAEIGEQADSRGSRFLQKPFRIAELISLLAESLLPAGTLQPKNTLH